MVLIDILFVEDEPDISDIVHLSMAMDPDISLTSFNDGGLAFSMIADTGQQFRFAMLNVRLPNISGIDLHKKLRRLPGMENLKSILITASMRELLAPPVDVTGIVGVIGKPFDPLTLAQRVRSLFNLEI